jgi:hypothetical protein
MKNKLFYFLLFIVFLFSFNISSAQLQAYRLGAINFHYGDTLGGTHNVLYFDIVLQHTNAEVSGPFDYAAAQYFFTFNPLIANGGTLTYRIVDSDLPPSLRPVNPSISGNLLRMAANLPTPPGWLISTAFPGTKIVRMSLRTSASTFASVPLNLKWNTTSPYPVIIAVFIGIFAFDVTPNGSYYIDSLNNFANVNLIQPAYNSSDNLSSVKFIWNKVRSARDYTIQISKDSLMNSLSLSDSLITDTSKTISALTLGSTYYWRLKIRDSSGVIYYSLINKFFTKPFLISPVDNSVNLNQTVNFIWNKLSDSAVKYVLLISEDSLMSTFVTSDTLLQDTNEIKSGFHYNSKYFWKVKAFYPTAGPDFSETRSFRTKNIVSALVSPLNNSVNNPLTINFIWHAPVPLISTRYYLKISNDSMQSDIFYSDSLDGLTSKPVSGFSLGSKYYWSVSVKDSFDNYLHSKIWNFKTGNLGVYLYSPENNSSGISTSPLMIWRKPVIDVSRYKLVISADSLQTDTVFQSTLTDTFKFAGGLDFEKKYYWSVTATDSLGTSKTSDVWNFITSTFLISPPDNSILFGPIPFQWYRLQSAISYRLQISSDQSFDNIIFADSSITDSTKTVNTLPFYERYFWRISAKNTSGYFQTSEVWNFQRDFPIPVELLNFNSSVTENTIRLNWSTVYESNNSGFEIERSGVTGQSSIDWMKVGNVSGNGTTSNLSNYSFTDRNLATGIYTYRLKQTDFNGNFEYFNLNNYVNIGIPAGYNLSQNYPNPFNPATSINYDLPAEGKVSLKIFDISGKEIMTLVNEVKTAGYYSVNFNASALSSGVYFYTISANNFVQTKKMILVK